MLWCEPKRTYAKNSRLGTERNSRACLFSMFPAFGRETTAVICELGMFTPYNSRFLFPKKGNKMRKKKKISIEEMIVKLEEVEKQTQKLSRQIHNLRTYYGPFYLDNSYVVQAGLKEVLSFVALQKQSLKSLLINK